MNEVTKIHLGRQAFTISVDAHHELKNYLEVIKKQVEDKDVVEEIELRKDLCFQRSKCLWLRGWDSNPGPHGYEPCELPLLHPATVDNEINHVLLIALDYEVYSLTHLLFSLGIRKIYLSKL
jgi:hypothetical protein